MVKVRDRYVAEDYLTIAVTALDPPLTADQLLAQRPEELTRILRGERQPLSRQEQDEVLRNRLSYFATDLVIPTWNAAFIYDTESGSTAALELFEFANSQLLEFRYYDDLLDAELGRIYAMLQRSSWWNNLFGRGYIRAANQLHSLFIDVNELTDRTENSLKIVGDIYAARGVHAGGGAPGARPLEAERRGQAGDARRHLSLRGGAGRHFARPVHGADHHPDPGARTGAVLPGHHESDRSRTLGQASSSRRTIRPTSCAASVS